MPLYDFKNTVTGERSSAWLSMSERESYLAEHPELEQELGAPGNVDSVRIGVKRNPDGFHDLVKHVRDSHFGSTIELRR